MAASMLLKLKLTKKTSHIKMLSLKNKDVKYGEGGEKVLSQSLVEHEEEMQGGLVYSTWQRIAVEGTCNCVKAEM